MRWKRKYLELREQVEKNMKLEALYDRLMAEKGEPNDRNTNRVGEYMGDATDNNNNLEQEVKGAE